MSKSTILVVGSLLVVGTLYMRSRRLQRKVQTMTFISNNLYSDALRKLDYDSYQEHLELIDDAVEFLRVFEVKGADIERSISTTLTHLLANVKDDITSEGNM